MRHFLHVSPEPCSPLEPGTASKRHPAGPSKNGKRYLAVFAAILVGATASHVLGQGTPVVFSDGRQPGEAFEVRATLQMAGKLKSPAADAEDVATSAAAQVRFQEVILERSGEQVRSVRNYALAEAELRAGNHVEKNSLSENVRTILANLGTPGIELVSRTGYLTRTEMETITFAGDSLAVYCLLPHQEVTEGEQWTQSSEDLATLLNLEHVGVNEVRSRFAKVENGLAIIQTTGSLKGRAAGVATSMRLTSEIRYDLRWKRINWLHLRLREDRDESSEAPGFAVDAEIKMLIQPAKADAMASWANTTAEINDRNRLLRYDSINAGFKMLHPRRWHLFNEAARHTTWRIVDGDKVVAQCNVIRLKDLPEGKQIGLEEFQADVRSALGEKFVEFEQAGRKERKDGYDIVRVTAAGIVSQIPVRWIYYHISSPDGKRANVVFVLDRENLELLASDDVIAASSLALTTAADALPKVTEPQPQGNEVPAAGGETASLSSQRGSTDRR